MSSRRGFLSEISWFQVAASALAAVTAAWIASRLGVAGTLIGAALGSFVVTISTSFYGRTLDKGKTLIVQTASGTSVQKTMVDGQIAETFHEVEEAEGSPVLGAEVVEGSPRRLRWKVIIPTTLIVLAISIGAMGAYEVVTGNSYGIDRDNARIGNPLGGSGSSSDRPDDSDEKRKPKDEKTTTPAPRPDATTPAPAQPSAPQEVPPTTPAPAPTPAPTPTPSATPTPAATPTAPPE